jgi:hypothetical protein
MVKVQTSDVDGKPAQVSLGIWRINFGNHGIQTITVWQLKPFLYSTFTTVTTAGNVTMETKVRSLPKLNNENKTLLLNNFSNVSSSQNLLF